MDHATIESKFPRFKVIVLLISSALLQLACSRASFDAFAPVAPVDIAQDNSAIAADKSKLMVNYDQVADGATPADVTIELRNWKNEPLSGLTMSLTVSGSGNVIVPCGMSDSSGRIRCRVYSTTAETKQIQAIGIIVLSAWTQFVTPPASSSSFAVVSSAGEETLVTGPRLVASSGLIESDIVKRDSFGVARVYSSILGSILGE